MTTNVMIVDDEPDILELLTLTLTRMQCVVDTAANVKEAKRLIDQNDYALCLTDMRLPDGNGIDIIEHIQQTKPDLPVALITAHGNMDLAVQAMKAGAFDFLNKPIKLESLRNLVSTAVTSSNLPNADTNKTDIIGQSEAVKLLIKRINKLARSQAPVYVSGESGSGKELVARSIHQLGPRAQNAFVAVNCGAIQKELMESELFGHKKGAFTGAIQEKQGLFKAAHGGTLFLDEVADLPLDMQVKLLRAIQEKAVRPVGSETEINIDVRILCATHKDLEQLVEDGDFRQDLFYRLNVIQLDVPPLRDRLDDLPYLIEGLLKKITQTTNELPPLLSKNAMLKLHDYSFPGNIRELENILERAWTLCEDNTIEEHDLLLSSKAVYATSSLTTQLSTDTSQTETKKQHPAYIPGKTHETIDDYLNEIEKEILHDILEKTRWNKTLAAKKLGISFRSIRYRLSKLGLDDEN